ncbi:hypothetical protein DAPPUDRAFT_309025 [Daphnia pulex]|uniref:Uncharacterized protein n=1 Tax=Daphnia pulex TaxID=6669 RepID=E9G425_DAPPU|nr:hypothetical protein DAPPUDRAFT_309025 [Daphnia pulex]|eukprot:EFX85871.1 hypothetical protein DAPPUDRAFT_309025 [Daphnia pulex]
MDTKKQSSPFYLITELTIFSFFSTPGILKRRTLEGENKQTKKTNTREQSFVSNSAVEMNKQEPPNNNKEFKTEIFPVF